MTNPVSYILYGLGTKLYFLLIHFAALFNHKAKQSIEGRKHIFEKIKNNLKSEPRKSYWFHCASLGEFEQARPIIEKLKAQKPEMAIIITFFSPSGYEIKKNYKGADYIFYLPFDTRSNAERFINLINPEKVFFIKYEFWYHYINTLHKLNIPTYLVAAHFTQKQIFFRWYGGLYRDILHKFTFIFTQFPEDVSLLKRIGIEHVKFTGDPRFDRVYENAKHPKELPLIASFCKDKKVIILGSSYQQEEDMMATCIGSLPQDTVVVVAPHEVGQHRLVEIESSFSKFDCCRLSNYHPYINCRILIIDNIGMLSNAYQYAHFAFVGGGFGTKGLHNILEPLAMGCFVITGPNNHLKFPEIKLAIAANAAAIVNDPTQLMATIKELTSTIHTKKKFTQSQQFIVNNIGATEKILLFI
jgi:3-deoxy-D-manno-octulosonic-acid transferase